MEIRSDKMKLEVLDHGFAELIDSMGDYKSVARAARVSYKSKSSDESDKKLMSILLKQGHDSPFEHAVMTFHIKAPIFVARHFVRHRIASWNELSGRYTELKDEFYIPSKKRANGSDISAIEESLHKAYETYNKLISKGCTKEVARTVLPVSTYTEWFWTLNVRSLMNVLNLRAVPAAQKETQEYAVAMGRIWQDTMPELFAAYISNHAPQNSLLLNFY